MYQQIHNFIKVQVGTVYTVILNHLSFDSIRTIVIPEGSCLICSDRYNLRVQIKLVNRRLDRSSYGPGQEAELSSDSIIYVKYLPLYISVVLDGTVKI